MAPKDGWCIELKRFYDEVTYDIVALSGMKFFYLTKRLVLSVIISVPFSLTFNDSGESDALLMSQYLHLHRWPER